MSVLIVTSVGGIVVDLHTNLCPLTTKNFLELCKMKYYNGCLFHKVDKDFMAQTGNSVYRFLYGEQARFFADETHPDLKHSRMGTVAMANTAKNCNASQFYFTPRDDIDYLDEKHAVFGVVAEKERLDTLAKINESLVDDNGRPTLGLCIHISWTMRLLILRGFLSTFLTSLQRANRMMRQQRSDLMRNLRRRNLRS